MSSTFSFLFRFLAYAISFAHSSKISGWQVLFIVEGLLPIINGILTLYLVPDFPSTSKWLSVREVNIISQWLHKDSPREEGNTWSTKEVLDIFRDPTWYLFSLFWIVQGVGLPVVASKVGRQKLIAIPPFAGRWIRCFDGPASRYLRPRLHRIARI